MADYGAIITRYKDIRGGIIEAFHAIQAQYSYLNEEAIIAVAEAFQIPAKDAYGVATFYSMFSVKPRGKYIVRICESAPCHIAGAAQVVEALEKELGIKMGQTTADGKYTLEFTECVGQCQATPVITINGKPYEGVSAEKISAILAECQ